MQAAEPEKIVMQLLSENPLPAIVAEEMAEEILQQPETEDKALHAPIFFEISSSFDQIPMVAFEVPEVAPLVEVKKEEEEIEPEIINELTEDASKPVSSTGGYLAKPQNLYVEEIRLSQPKPESNTTEELTPLQSKKEEDEPLFEMQMVVKNSHQAAEETPVQPSQTQPIFMSKVEEPALQDETDELRRRAIDRIAKLRNLSFNINASDPNNEFETVPAYLRRNMELHNSIADVESFYSNYSVKSDDNNQAEISTINTFLDGKKPD
jgi:cell division protein FtsZ